MEKNKVLQALEVLRKSPKRNFSQTIDLIVNFQGLDPKKRPDTDRVDFFMNLPKSRGRDIKICALVDVSMKKAAEDSCHKVILDSDFVNWAKKKKDQKALEKECDWFIAQAPLMGKVAQTFGKVLGPKGKMPNPKAGCVVPPTADLKALVARLTSMVRIRAVNELAVKLAVGKDAQSDDDISDNILAVYNTLVSKLPQEKNNISSVLIKFTMSPAVDVENPVLQEEPKEEKEEPALDHVPEVEE